MDEFRLVLERGRLQWHQRYSCESEEDLGSRRHSVQQVRVGCYHKKGDLFFQICTKFLISRCPLTFFHFLLHAGVFFSEFFQTQSRFEGNIKQQHLSIVTLELILAVIVTRTKFSILMASFLSKAHLQGILVDSSPR